MRTEKKLLGVCAWLADKFEMDVGTLRLVWIILTILGVGSPILAYIILAVLKPPHY